MDWNNDGKKDLLTGEYNGRIRIYLNMNTDADPVFNGYDILIVGTLPFDCGNFSSPHVVDWNGDGKKDLLCGESSGRVCLMINVGTGSAPAFSSKEYILDGGIQLDVGMTSHPTVCDLNRDGKKDLIVGGSTGKLTYFENKGTDTAPVFNGKSDLYAGGRLINVLEYSNPDVADWNEDGVMEILCGNWESSSPMTGHVYYFEAVGPLALNDNRIFAGTGGSVAFSMNAGVANGSRNYLVLGSVTGTGPGTPLPGGYATLPLNWDPYTDLVLLLVNSPVFSNFMGKLDASGQATAQLNVPPLPSTTVGLVMHYSYCLNNMFDYVSNPTAIEVVP